MIVEFQPGAFEPEQAMRDKQYLEKNAPSRADFMLDLERMHIGETDRGLVMTAFDYGASLDYTERGSTAGGYFMHPVRVTRLLAGYRDTMDAQAIICALLHNVLETAHADTEELIRVAGPAVVARIQALTIDRQRQQDPVYLAAYYDGIRQAGAGDVKVVDKMDNLFLLHVAPDADVRRRYIEEIRHHVVPLCQACLPAASSYLDKLIDYVTARERMAAP
jgi:(p)ppGpp synthase/HD superfamily hydrolase